MLTYVLGAPGSGKSTIVPFLRRLLPGHVIVDWDAFMPAATELAARDVRRSASTWPGYTRLVRAVVDTVRPIPLVVLGVCTPDELIGWSIDTWLLLDCSDEERRKRLAGANERSEIADVLGDAARYRSLGLPVIDSTGRTPQSVANGLALLVR